jgi:fumarate hydratase subunit beta
MINLTNPFSKENVQKLKIGDKILINGIIYTGRDAVLPKLVAMIEKGEMDKVSFNIQDIAIMHTAVSDAGISPTTSNKEEIESSIPKLAEAGVKIHIGKGSLSEKTINALHKEDSIFVLTPPVAALLTNNVKSKKVVAFEEEGIEAIFELKVENIPGIVAIANDESIF